MRFFILFLFTNTQGFSTATFPFSVSHKIDLLNQLNASNGTMNNNQRTLEIIREDLASSAMNESEGTCWDSGHRHLFVVMGASVKSLFLMSLLYQNNDFYFIFLGGFGEKENLSYTLVAIPRWSLTTCNHFLRLCSQ